MKKMIAFFILCFTMPATASSWKVFVYMDATDHLWDMALKNITDMIKIPPHDTVTVRIQLHAYDITGVRYHLTQNGLSYADEITLTGESKQDFIDAATWAFEDNESEHTMLIFWNHGWGILDPIWNEEIQEWQVGLDHIGHTCPIEHTDAQAHELHRKFHKGFMFRTEPRTYLNNQDMIDGLSLIKNQVLKGKELDLIAFDTCMGGMFEIAYQLAPYCSYLIGNESCALHDGFDYTALIQALNQNSTARDLATRMVAIFDDYYQEHDKNGIYVHSALDTAHVADAAETLDTVIEQLFTREDHRSFLEKARIHTPHFCLFSMYTDLVAFIKQIDVQLPEDETTEALKLAMHNFYDAIQRLVVSECHGYTYENNVFGCAIYLPTNKIDSSYRKTIFCQNTQWLRLLQALLPHSQETRS